MGGLLSKTAHEGDDHHRRMSPAEQRQPQRAAPSSRKPPNFSPPSNYPSSEHENRPPQDRRERAPAKPSRSAVPRPNPSTDSSLSRETETLYSGANSLAEETSLSPRGRQLPDPSAKDHSTVTSGAASNGKDTHQSKPANAGAIEANVNSPPRNPVEVRPTKVPKPRVHPPQDAGVPPSQVALIGTISHVHYVNERRDMATGTSIDAADHAETHLNAKAPTTPPNSVFMPSPAPDTALYGARTDAINTPPQGTPQDLQPFIHHQPSIFKKIYYIRRFRLHLRTEGSSPGPQPSSSVTSLPVFTSSAASRPTEIHRVTPHPPEPSTQPVKRCVSLSELRQGLFSSSRSKNFNALDLTKQLPDRIEIKNSGGFSDVSQARLGSRLVAVKALRATDMSPFDECRMRKRLGREIYVWAGLEHRYVLELLGFAFLGGRACLISPWCENGTLQEYLQRRKDVDRRILVRQVAEGLNYLHMHDPPIVHGDFKTTNILVTGDGVAKICDFGGSKHLGETNTGFTTGGIVPNTVLYSAPEIIRDGIHPTLQSDVYSFAWVALETMTSRRPFWNIQNLATVINKVVWERQTPSPVDYPELKDEILWGLLQRCWSYDPLGRPTMIEVCNELASAQYGPAAAFY